MPDPMAALQTQFSLIHMYVLLIGFSVQSICKNHCVYYRAIFSKNMSTTITFPYYPMSTAVSLPDTEERYCLIFTTIVQHGERTFRITQLSWCCILQTYLSLCRSHCAYCGQDHQGFSLISRRRFKKHWLLHLHTKELDGVTCYNSSSSNDSA